MQSGICGTDCYLCNGKSHYFSYDCGIPSAVYIWWNRYYRFVCFNRNFTQHLPIPECAAAGLKGPFDASEVEQDSYKQKNL